MIIIRFLLGIKTVAICAHYQTTCSFLGIRDNRFGLVGYGGEGVDNLPHTHTIKSKLFGAAESLRIGTANLDTKPGAYKDVRAAVKFAAQYPFRAGVAKAVILVPCSKCSQSKMSENAIKQILHDRDIVLHVLQNEDFTLNVKTPKASNIIGMDHTTAFTMRDALNVRLQGDNDLFQQIIVPKDTCMNLAIQRHGSVFNIRKMNDRRIGSAKYFIEVVARRVAESARPSQQQICKCVSDNNGNTNTVCKAVATPIMKVGVINRYFFN